MDNQEVIAEMRITTIECDARGGCIVCPRYRRNRVTFVNIPKRLAPINVAHTLSVGVAVVMA